jgi:hypothetical protein
MKEYPLLFCSGYLAGTKPNRAVLAQVIIAA